MNIKIYIENALGKTLCEQSKLLHKTRNAIILEAIQEWMLCHKTHEWPSIVLNFKGVKDFPRFESHRKELKKAKDAPFESDSY